MLRVFESPLLILLAKLLPYISSSCVVYFDKLSGDCTLESRFKYFLAFSVVFSNFLCKYLGKQEKMSEQQCFLAFGNWLFEDLVDSLRVPYFDFLGSFFSLFASLSFFPWFVTSNKVQIIAVYSILKNKVDIQWL